MMLVNEIKLKDKKIRINEFKLYDMLKSRLGAEEALAIMEELEKENQKEKDAMIKL